MFAVTFPCGILPVGLNWNPGSVSFRTCVTITLRTSEQLYGQVNDCIRNNGILGSVIKKDAGG